MTFLTSLAIILLASLVLGSIFAKIKLPPLVGMLIVGIVMSPHLLNLIAPSILAISPDLRQLALIIILTRAGLSLNFSDLKKVGRPAILMCFVPATFEICGYMIFGSLLLKLPLVESAILGTVLAAVSPAVVVPRMIKLQNEGYGVDKGIPQMITAGASCDDVFVIVIFTALLAMSTGRNFNLNIIWRIPLSIILGVGVGCLFGFLFYLLFKHVHMRDTIKIIILLSFSFLFVALETLVAKYVPFSGLIAVISLGVMLNSKDSVRSKRLSTKYNKMWVFAEILLFVLVGAEVDFAYVATSALMIVAVMFLALILRVCGVFACLICTKLNLKERVFCAIAYLPKATVQAAIGAIPLAVGLASGQIILTCAVLAILITAPLGAFATDISYKKLLHQTFDNSDNLIVK